MNVNGVLYCRKSMVPLSRNDFHQILSEMFFAKIKFMRLQTENDTVEI